MIKKSIALLFISILFITTIGAQTKPERAVAAAVETLRKAMVDGDRAMLEKIAADSLSYGHSSGKIENKTAFVENIANGNSGFATINLTDQTIYVSGNIAIVRHKFAATTDDKGKVAGTVNLAIMTVWQKQKNTWKMLARQAVKLI